MKYAENQGLYNILQFGSKTEETKPLRLLDGQIRRYLCQGKYVYLLTWVRFREHATRNSLFFLLKPNAILNSSFNVFLKDIKEINIRWLDYLHNLRFFKQMVVVKQYYK